jgi:hypothetical protein
MARHMTSQSAVENDDAPLLLCPACGFDLRATAADRRGECGLEIDREGLRLSGIPWTHRGGMGRTAAYLKTAWQFALDRGIQYEVARPQEIRDGRAFARITACLVAVALVGAFLAGIYAAGGLVALGIQPATASLSSTSYVYDGRTLNLMLPWSAGATVPGVLPICLIGLAFWLTGAQRFAFRARSATDDRARSTVTLSYYTTTPLLLLLAAAASFAPLAWLIHNATGAYAPQYPAVFLKYPRASLALLVATGVIVLAAFGLTLLRIGQGLTRTRPCGLVPAVLGVGEVIGLWLFGGVVLLGLGPWCVGFLWIAVDSLR